MSAEFYANLPELQHFLDITDSQHFRPVPTDWLVVLTDVKGSTEAVSAGRYKEVNMIGASSIVALLNVAGSIEIPFIFGGDGATLLIPPVLREVASGALLALQDLSLRELNLELRAGIVPVNVVIDDSHHINVSKFKVSENYVQAVFSGGGLAYAEKLIKDPATADQYVVTASGPVPEADLSGLECRWQDIPSKFGEIVSLLVMATVADSRQGDAINRDVINTIETIYGGEENYNPISVESLQLTYNPLRLLLETRLRIPSGVLKRLRYLASILGFSVISQIYIAIKSKILGRKGYVNAMDAYREIVLNTSDYKKYDDTLRMVIAGTSAQREALTAYLEAGYERGDLIFGLHIADRALMTCLVFQRFGRQVHFVDGAEGGYALAAKAMKERLRDRAQRLAG